MSFDELVNAQIPALEDIYPITSVEQAYGILMGVLEDYWSLARIQPGESLSQLVNIAVASQLIAESLFGLIRKDKNNPEPYKKEYEYVMGVLTELIKYIKKNHTEVEPFQKGQAPRMSVVFERRWLNELISRTPGEQKQE